MSLHLSLLLWRNFLPSFLTAIVRHCNGAIFGCGDELGKLKDKLKVNAWIVALHLIYIKRLNVKPLATKKAHVWNQTNLWKALVVLYQLALDLTGSNNNALAEYSVIMSQEQFLEQSRASKELSQGRLVARTQKFLAFYTGRWPKEMLFCSVWILIASHALPRGYGNGKRNVWSWQNILFYG